MMHRFWSFLCGLAGFAQALSEHPLPHRPKELDAHAHDELAVEVAETAKRPAPAWHGKQIKSVSVHVNACVVEEQ